MARAPVGLEEPETRLPIGLLMMILALVAFISGMAIGQGSLTFSTKAAARSCSDLARAALPDVMFSLSLWPATAHVATAQAGRLGDVEIGWFAPARALLDEQRINRVGELCVWVRDEGGRPLSFHRVRAQD